MLLHHNGNVATMKRRAFKELVAALRTVRLKKRRPFLRSVISNPVPIKQDKIFFVSMGCQTLADPFLAFVARVLWNGSSPSTDLAMIGVLWVSTHTVSYAPMGIGKPLSLAVLKKIGGKWRARKLDGDELQEQEQHITEIEKHIGGYPQTLLDEATTSAPPKPPTEEEEKGAAASDKKAGG